MALVKCPECGHEISAEAQVCPKCGHPITYLKWKTKCLSSVLAILVIVVFIAIAKTRNENREISPSSQSSSYSKDAITPVQRRISEHAVASLSFSTGTIYVGQLFDSALKIIATPMTNLKVEDDPSLPGSLQVIKSVNFEGKNFLLVMARQSDPGPYVIRSIVVE